MCVAKSRDIRVCCSLLPDLTDDSFGLCERKRFDKVRLCKCIFDILFSLIRPLTTACQSRRANHAMIERAMHRHQKSNGNGKRDGKTFRRTDLQVYGNVCSHSHVLVENFVQMCADDDEFESCLFSFARTHTHTYIRGHSDEYRTLCIFETICDACVSRVNREM